MWSSCHIASNCWCSRNFCQGLLKLLLPFPWSQTELLNSQQGVWGNHPLGGQHVTDRRWADLVWCHFPSPGCKSQICCCVNPGELLSLSEPLSFSQSVRVKVNVWHTLRRPCTLPQPLSSSHGVSQGWTVGHCSGALSLEIVTLQLPVGRRAQSPLAMAAHPSGPEFLHQYVGEHLLPSGSSRGADQQR